MPLETTFCGKVAFMMINSKWFLLVCVIVLHGLASIVIAQDRSDDIVRIKTRVVFLDVLVKDKRTGRPITDLPRESFQVLDEGRPRNLSYFSSSKEATCPLALVLVLDLRLGGAGRYLRQPEVIRSLAAAFAKLSPQDEITVLATWVNGAGPTSERLIDFTHDRAKVSAALENVPLLIKPPVDGNEGLLSTLPKIKYLAAERPTSQLVVIYVTDDFNMMVKNMRDEYAADLLRTNTIFCLLVCDQMRFVKTGLTVFSPLFALGGIDVHSAEYFADQTGGEKLFVHKPEDYGKALESLIGNLKARYNLGFTLPEDEPADGRLHRLEIRVKTRNKQEKESDLKVIAPKAYYLPIS